MTMALGCKPQHDQAVQQHRHRRGAFDRFAGPARRLLDAQVNLGVVEGPLNLPTCRGKDTVERRVVLGVD